MLHLLCAGMRNEDIEKSCGVSASTVKRHLVQLFEKIGVSSRLEAAMFAVSKGLVTVDQDCPQREALLIEIESRHQKIEKEVGRLRVLVQQLAGPQKESHAHHKSDT